MLDNAFQRRREIERMLLSGKKLTTAKLMSKYGVGKNAIRRDFDIIGSELPLIVKQGYDGGIFILESYKPYNNTLTQTEQEFLCRLHEKAEGKEKEILSRIIRKYGAYRLEI